MGAIPVNCRRSLAAIGHSRDVVENWSDLRRLFMTMSIRLDTREFTGELNACRGNTSPEYRVIGKPVWMWRGETALTTHAARYPQSANHPV
ncbi:hypothetical protein [Burkholderia stabilis]|uniref:hypothetical protein n=1 Tax=Burkholderia stabilis TaxID=95485 RepID=UPI00158B5405|nr:hypothetical protein [Burkholderia stabilis]